MLLGICELILNIVHNLLILLNKRKQKNTKSKAISTKSSDFNNLKEILTELRRIEDERKRIFNSEVANHDAMKAEVKELNERLKSIEKILYDKRTNLLKEKIVNNNSKENDKWIMGAIWLPLYFTVNRTPYHLPMLWFSFALITLSFQIQHFGNSLYLALL